MYHGLFLETMAFFEVHVYNDLEYFLQELASSLFFEKGASFPQTLKHHFKFQAGVIVRI